MNDIITSKSFDIVSVNEQTLLQRISSVTEQVSRVEIKDDDDFAKGGTFIKAVRNLKKEIDDERKLLVDPLNDEVKLINARFKERTGVIDSAVATVQPKLDAYLREKEKARQLAIAEERAKREAEALANATQLEAQGATQAADLALQQGMQKTAAEKQKLGATSEYGVTTSATETWSGEEADVIEILKAVINGDLPLATVSISKAQLNTFAREKKQEGVFCGVKIVRQLKAVAR